jgi:hypothetical protein
VLTQYPTNNFPEVAYPGQLAIDGNQHTLAYYSATGAWQSVPGANGGQSFYQPTAPTSGMNLNDTWYNTANDNQVSFWNGTAWQLMPFGTNAIANTITGKTIQTAYAGQQRLALSSANTITMYGYTADPYEVSPAGLTMGEYQYSIMGHPPTMTTQLLGAGTNAGNNPAFISIVNFGSATTEIDFSANNFKFEDPDSGYTSIQGGYSQGYQITAAGVISFGSYGPPAGGVQFIGNNANVSSPPAIMHALDFGKVTSATTSGSGGVLVTHGLGVTPTVVNVTPFMAATNVGWRITAMTSSDFTIGFFTCSTGAVLAATNVGFTWEVKV